MAVLCMRNASGHNYRNSSVIVDLAMGQIPRSTECISSFHSHSHQSFESNFILYDTYVTTYLGLSKLIDKICTGNRCCQVIAMSLG